MTTYNFDSALLDKALDIINATNRKAEKAGIAERIEFTVNDYSVKVVDEDGIAGYEEWFALDLTVPVSRSTVFASLRH
ncbi:MAG: hypothetical protein IPJ71_19650 [Bdellovibrionales bacterium]|nr:hypothetical protein [Bdellovibrionales bacterium]